MATQNVPRKPFGAEDLIRTREQSGYTQAAVAELLGVSVAQGRRLGMRPASDPAYLVYALAWFGIAFPERCQQ
jgi:transcriptional regulator with XRE-family HTH domain